MKQLPFGALCAALVALGTAFGFLAIQLRASGYEPHVQGAALASVLMHFTAIMTAVTWARARQSH
ncbi:SCO3870 family protein [Streptomyces sp. WM6378]|uniref:SCO3870 family protein n=1 Tax=Streptomyces sp. WM6378 TaxID=1415557 RepID=UPI0006AF3685|nr:SCO3870 family protein [Streptomyces sp. WM6378]KOU52291.1 membrane protein [Streptomyces sp. WM6378]